MFVQGPRGPLFEHNGRGAVDSRGVPEAGSAAIDAGVAIPGVTDGFVGQAPDLGAYEQGAPYWKAGATGATWPPRSISPGESHRP